MTENQQEENSAEQASRVKASGYVIEDSPGFLTVRVRLYRRLILWAFIWPIVSLCLIVPFFTYSDFTMDIGLLVAVVFFFLYVIGAVRIPFTIDIDKGAKTARIPWPFVTELLFPIKTDSYPPERAES